MLLFGLSLVVLFGALFLLFGTPFDHLHHVRGR